MRKLIVSKIFSIILMFFLAKVLITPDIINAISEINETASTTNWPMFQHDPSISLITI